MSLIIQADESGSLLIPSGILSKSLPRMRYVVTPNNRGIHIEPELVTNDSQKLSVCGEDWAALSDDIGRKWSSDMSAVELVSEMRR